MNIRTPLAPVCTGLFLLLSITHTGQAREQSSTRELTVFAASDLGPAFRGLVPLFERDAGAKVTVVLGSTGILAQQIRHGAPADVFFAADERRIQELAPDGLLLLQTRTVYARGRLAAVALKSSGVRVDALSDLANPAVRRIAIANPLHAPYGLAAEQALQASGLWSAIRTKLVYGENVQQAVQFVRSGSVDAGLVARSVAGTSDLNWTLVSDSLHAPLVQMAVVLARAPQPSLALSFLQFVNGPHGRWELRRFGFLLPGEDF